MKHGIELQAWGPKRFWLVTVVIVAGLLPAARTVRGEDKTFSPSQPLPAAPTVTDVDAALDVNQIHAHVKFLSVPSELATAAVADWILAPWDQAELAATDPFADMHQPLQRSHAKPEDTSRGQITTGTEMRIPSMHKILTEQEARQLLSGLQDDKRTQSIFSPQLVFIDGMTASAVQGKQTPFVVGWKQGLPQTRTVLQGRMVRLRTVLDDDKIWLDYEIVLSRILEVTSQSIRVADRPQPITLAVPNVQTSKATATVALPIGSTVLIGGLPAESTGGTPRQLLVLLRADRMREPQHANTAQSAPPRVPSDAAAGSTEPEPLDAAAPRASAAGKKRNPFSLISRILNRATQETPDLQETLRDERSK